ncbi:unnamed protein product, partial [Rotaria socialis]
GELFMQLEREGIFSDDMAWSICFLFGKSKGEFIV